MSPSTLLNSAYHAAIRTTSVTKPSNRIETTKIHPNNDHTESINQDGPMESMLLSKNDSRLIAESLELPELAVEIERAVGQIEKSLAAEGIERQEKRQLEAAEEEARPKG